MVRKWPMVAGMDGAGIGAASEPPEFVRGDRVLRNGYGVGETHRGRLAQKARLSGDGLILVPAALSPRSRSSTIASSAELPGWPLAGPRRRRRACMTDESRPPLFIPIRGLP